MKKLFSSLIVLMLCLSFAIGAIGCGDEGETGELTQPYSVWEPETTHIRTAPDIEGKYIVKDGKSDYSIVLPTEFKTNKYYATAKEELILFMKRATGITLSASYDVDSNGTKEHNANQHYISIGDTNLFKTSGITAQEFDRESLFGDGYRIITKDNNIYILADSAKGLMYGVYGFLEITLNFEYYYRNCYDLDTNVLNMPLKNFDVKEIPDVPYRGTPNGTAFSSNGGSSRVTVSEQNAGLEQQDFENASLRFRYNYGSVSGCLIPTYQHWDMSSNKSVYHNTSELFSGNLNTAKEVFDACEKWPNFTQISDYYTLEELTKHSSKWDASNGVQWCFTARGDEEALDALALWTAIKMEYSLMMYPNSTHGDVVTLAITGEDSGSCCDCSACQEAFLVDGNSYQGGIIRLCNKVVNILKEWQRDPRNADYSRGDKLNIIYFAYAGTEDPPAIYDEDTNTYTLANENCKMDKNVGVWITHLADYESSYYNYEATSKNQRYYELLDFYAREAGFMWYYNYVVNYLDNTEFIDNISWTTTATYSSFKHASIKGQYHIAGLNNEENYNWGNLRVYLDSKLNWNCTLDCYELANKFMKAMYGPAASYMEQALHRIRVHTQTMRDYTRIMSADKAMVATFWTYTGFYKPYYEELCLAYNEIDKSIKDSAQATLYKERIETEMIAPLYTMIYRWQDMNVAPFDLQTRQAYINKLSAILKRLPQIVPARDAGTMYNWIQTI